MDEKFEFCPVCGEWGLVHVSGDTYQCEQCLESYEIEESE